jgi:hypothetical protein
MPHQALGSAGRGPPATGPRHRGGVTFTDGEENSSREYDRASLFDSYEEGRKVGYEPGNTQNFAADAAGSRAAFTSLGSSVARRRGKIRTGEAYDRADLFEGDKGADQDLKDRQPRSDQKR